MNANRRFQIIAYGVTILFTLIILYPLFYIGSSALKDKHAIYEVPPKLLPDAAQTLLFEVDYTDYEDIDEDQIIDMMEEDAVRLFYGTLNHLAGQPVYEYNFAGKVGDSYIYSLRAHKMLLELERDFGVYAATILNEKTLTYENRPNEAVAAFKKTFDMDGLDISTKEYVDFDESMKTFMESDYEMKGQLIQVTNSVNNWLHLESFTYYHKLPAYAYHQNEKIVTFSFFAFMGNTVLVIGWAMVIQTLLCSLSAFPISRMLSPKMAKIVLMFFLGTTMIPVVSILLPQFIMFREMGFYDNYLALLLPFLLPFGFYVYLYKGFFDQLPGSLFEAARIDGASHFYTYSRIALPLSKPIISLIALQTFLSNWNDYLWAWMVTERQELWTLNVALYNLSQNMAIKQNFLMGLSVLTILPVLLITIIFSSKVKQSIASTGIKG